MKETGTRRNPSFQDEGVNTFLFCSNNILCLSTWCLVSLTREPASPALRLASQPAHVYWVPLLGPRCRRDTFGLDSSELLKPLIPPTALQTPIHIPVCWCYAGHGDSTTQGCFLIRLLWLLNNKLLHLPFFSFPSTLCLLTVPLHTYLMSSIN